MQGYMETGLGDVWQTVTGLAKHVLTHPAARSSAEPAVPDARVGQAGQAMRALALLHSLPAPPTLLPLPFWDLLGIRIPKTDSEIHEKKEQKVKGRKQRADNVSCDSCRYFWVSSWRADIFTPTFAGGSTPNYNQFMSQRPKVILNWVQSHFRANLQGKCKFQRVCTH